MKIFVLGSTLLALTSLAACGKSSPPAAAPAPQVTADTAPQVAADTASKSEPEVAVTPPDTAVVDDAEPAESPAERQCKAILAKGFEAVKPNLAKLGYTPTPKQEAAAKNDKGFVEACAALSDELRKCLEDADNPIAAITPCKVNEPKQTLWAPNHGMKIELHEPGPLPAEEIAPLLEWMKGTWVNTWESAKETQRWVIGEEGKVISAEVTRRGEPDPTANIPESITFKRSRRMEVRWKGSTTDQKHSFLRDGDDVFYASTNLLYDAYPIPDEQRFVVKLDWSFIVVEGASCEAILSTGEAVPASCKFGEDGGTRTFEVEFTEPGRSSPTRSVFRVVNKHLVSQSLFESGRFVRQK